MKLVVDERVRECFPDLVVLVTEIRDVEVQESSDELEKFKLEVYERVKLRYNLESLKDDPTVRLYRDFFWRMGIDPTKIRPAAEALIRRILGGEGLPTINTLVDAYNLASAESCIALAAFDADKVEGDMLMRFAEEGETFLGIGMREPKILKGGELVVSDSKRLIAIYPYRDADYSKITLQTKNVYLMTCGVPGLSSERLRKAEELAIKYIAKFCGNKSA
ncbi:MAG: phenylalanine--tRNA ligase beta subunit-related protein [Nitrososphaerota archaeon]|nr:phenylalanine--tRNA ligase beta subunit-related protein [Nitrososphaerota archaeon]